jgi:hypothetical protein
MSVTLGLGDRISIISQSHALAMRRRCRAPALDLPATRFLHHLIWKNRLTLGKPIGQYGCQMASHRLFRKVVLHQSPARSGSAHGCVQTGSRFETAVHCQSGNPRFRHLLKPTWFLTGSPEWPDISDVARTWPVCSLVPCFASAVIHCPRPQSLSDYAVI